MTTNAYAAKRAIFNRLQELARTGPLSTMGVDGGPLQVKYDNRPRDMQARCIFGGGVRFDRDPAKTVVEGRRELAEETAITTWFIRVAGTPDVEIVDLDEQAETIGEVLGRAIAADPQLAGGSSVSRLFAGQGDYTYDDDSNISKLGYEIHTDSVIE